MHALIRNKKMKQK